MNHRSLCYALIALSAAVFIAFLSACSAKDPNSTTVFPAMVKRNCAPWDGGAFVVSIRHARGSVIDISIWRSPDIPGPIQYSFPDRTRSIGAAMLVEQAGMPAELTGSVHFQGVQEGTPVVGEFSLVTASGRGFRGKFIATWGNEIVACG